MADDRLLVVGLGNPGPRYAATRHNAGFLVVDELAARLGGSFKSPKALSGRADVIEGRLAGQPVVLAKPRSYMNESGGPIVTASRFYKIAIENIVVVHDELDLPFGGLRLKRGGGEGGHNGLKSTTAALGSKEYARVRFGIGRPPGRQDPAEYVLREFSAAERKELAFLVDRAADSVECLV
ncbi:MAG: peptidyl-tRNA hydrolase, family, partial [Pseudonocardiales bacterium]|nr:peptidyl-tRNA hydrolase, family [Pseudonocardiales bacterium]